ncbi:MAG: 3-dehydroquinate synthase [Oscillospiraceae bacterium]|nr:3-dehydroquinate synthase [Oscillospiraceae bacterium]
MNVVRVPASSSYEVKLGSGLLQSLGAEAARLTKGKALVVTDENVAPLYLAAAYRSLHDAGLGVCTISLPAGEATKSPEFYLKLLNLLAEKQFTRSDLLIALGGGVIGDLTGFVAATYLRGVPLIQVPTTLLSMVDSSVGGKTAIDLPAGKNLVGAFCQPSLVLCDIDSLNSLPKEIFSDGCAEVIKTAILFDGELFAHLQEKGKNFDREYVISACVRHKRDVVCADEFDRGERQKLNLGHTIAHGIEKESGYLISHGRAVAAGTAMMARAFCKDREAIVALLQQFDLPVTTEFSAPTLAKAALADKKRSGDTVTLVVPHAIGDCRLEKVPVSDLETIIQRGY